MHSTSVWKAPNALKEALFFLFIESVFFVFARPRLLTLLRLLALLLAVPYLPPSDEETQLFGPLAKPLCSRQSLHAVMNYTCFPPPCLFLLRHTNAHAHSFFFSTTTTTPLRKECAWLAEQSGRGALKARCRGWGWSGVGWGVTRDFQSSLCQGCETLQRWQALSPVPSPSFHLSYPPLFSLSPQGAGP